MYPVEVVMNFDDVFEFVYLGFIVSVVAFLTIYFMCYGLTIMINIFKKVSR